MASALKSSRRCSSADWVNPKERMTNPIESTAMTGCTSGL
jgi:hypothetical protein